MNLQLRATTPSQIEDVAELLCKAFGASPSRFFADRRLLEWKYFESADVWKRPCSFILRDAESLAAHCALAPLTLSLPGNEKISAVCFVDWVSARQWPFAGMMLKKQLLALGDVAIVVGGTSATRALLPRLGFSPHGSVDTYARVLRPFRQWRTRPRTQSYKDAARLIRNALWTVRSSRAATLMNIEVLRVSEFSDQVHTQLQDMTIPVHGVELLNYWLRCPTVPVEGYVVRTEGGATLGQFLLVRVGGQTRIADLRLTSDDPAQWQVAFEAAVEVASADPATCEVAVLASTDFIRNALVNAGFRKRDSNPLSIYDPRCLVREPLLWSYIDTDAAYLYDAARPYST